MEQYFLLLSLSLSQPSASLVLKCIAGVKKLILICIWAYRLGENEIPHLKDEFGGRLETKFHFPFCGKLSGSQLEL